MTAVTLGDQIGRAECPADLPAGGREGLAGRGDAHRTRPHAWEPGQREVLGIVEHQVLIDLVTDHQYVVLDGQAGDLGQIGPIEHDTGRVVRGVDQQGFRLAAEGSRQLGVVQAKVRSEEADPHPPTTGEIDRGRVGVVERLQGDHLITRVDEGEDGRRQRLGRPRRDQHLQVRVVAQPVIAPGVLRDRLPQRPYPATGWVLVDATCDRRLGLVQHEVRTVGIWETLAQVHGLGGERQGRHLREDRRRRRADPISLPGAGCHGPTLVPVRACAYGPPPVEGGPYARPWTSA